MREVARRMLQREQYQDLADTLDEQVIRETRDPDLLMDSTRAAANYYGFSSGLRFFEDLRETVLAADEEQVSRIRLFHRKLYADWLRQYLEERNPIHGWPAFDQARRFFPEDPEIHLLGVELALAENNWEKADRLLDAMDYPEALEVKARTVRQAIDGHRRKAGKIVIRFRPGSRLIPVRATVNGIFQQDFVIDTGATLVSIPSSTVQALGIAIGDDTPKRRISTAGGNRVVHEITLESIRLENQIVHQVKAFVLDIPDNPNIGLLGLNFLRRFHMEIDNEKGLLVLNPQ
jgi:clan AA aspartic protease (TIGR02281 family)